MVALMPTPQLISAAPDKYCPECGRRMQLLKRTETSLHYVCNAHRLQNSDTVEPYYLNIWLNSQAEDGTIRLQLDKPKKEPNYDPRTRR